MSLASRVDALAARIAVAVKALQNDPRWTNSRTPTAHASTHAANGSDPITPAAIGAAADSAVVHLTGTETINGAKTFGAAPAVPVGNLLTHPVRRDDARLTDARTPLAHAASHAPGQPDALTGYVPTSAIGAASGVAGLDAGGKIPQAQLPAIALVDFLGAVGSDAAMLALTGQRGDWATRTDLGVDYQLIAEPSTTLASWRAMSYPASPVSSVNGRTGVVTGLAEASALAGYQPVDSDLTTIAGLVPADGQLLRRVAGAWAASTLTAADVGAAATVHTHAAADITSGSFPASRLPGASPSAYGIVLLQGDLDGTAAAPTIRATGTRDATTYLRGDGAWATPPAGGASTRVTGSDFDRQVYGDLISNGHRDDAAATWAQTNTLRTFLVLLGRLPAGEPIAGFRMGRIVAAAGTVPALTCALFSSTALGATSWARAGAGNVTMAATGTGIISTPLAVAAQASDLWYVLQVVLSGSITTYPSWASSPAVPAAAAALVTPGTGSTTVSGTSSSVTAPGATINPTTGWTALGQKPWAALY